MGEPCSNLLRGKIYTPCVRLWCSALLWCGLVHRSGDVLTKHGSFKKFTDLLDSLLTMRICQPFDAPTPSLAGHSIILAPITGARIYLLMTQYQTTLSASRASLLSL